MGGKAGRGPVIDPTLSQGAYDTAYEIGLGGGEYSPAEGEYETYSRQGYDAGRTVWELNQRLAEVEAAPEPEAAPAPPPPPEPSGPSQAEIDAEAQRVREGTQARNTAYGEYLTAVQGATETVVEQMAREAANARLLGVDYVDSEEIRQQRISDVYSSRFSPEQESNLRNLISEFGEPAGFEGFIERGDPERVAAVDTVGETTTIARARGIRPRRPGTLLTEEEEELLGGQAVTVLG